MITYKLVRCRRIGIWLDAQVGELLDSTHVRSPVLGRLALRPGWHSCSVPFTDWIGKKGEDGRLMQRRDTVWIECEVEGDQLQISDRNGLRTIPHGWYQYRTRPGQPFPWMDTSQSSIGTGRGGSDMCCPWSEGAATCYVDLSVPETASCGKRSRKNTSSGGNAGCVDLFIYLISALR